MSDGDSVVHESDEVNSLKSENENLKQTISRLTLEMSSQKQEYENEINYLKERINVQSSECLKLEKVKRNLQSKIKLLTSQVTDCNEEISSKIIESEKLHSEIQGLKQKQVKEEDIFKANFDVYSYCRRPRTFPGIGIKAEAETETQCKNDNLDQDQQKQISNQKPTEHEQNLDSIIANLNNLTQKLSTQICRQDVHIEQNTSLLDSLKDTVTEFKTVNVQNNNISANRTNNCIGYDCKFTQPLTALTRSKILTRGSGGDEWKTKMEGVLNQRQQRPGSLARAYDEVETELEVLKLRTSVDFLTTENVEIRAKMNKLDERNRTLYEEMNLLRSHQNDLLQMLFE